MIGVTLILTIYLFEKMVSQTISIGQILSKIFKDYAVVNDYYFWLLTFYFLVIGLNFMKPNKIVPFFILGARYFCLLLMVGGSLYIVIFNNTLNDVFSFDGF
jgi:hypothetical protein